MSEKDEDEYDIDIPPPAKTLEGREEQLVSYAMDLAEKRLLAGTASAQETVHFLKLGSTRNILENDKLKHEVTVLQSRVTEMESRKSSEEMYEKALRAIRGYQGLDPIEEDLGGEFDENYY